MASKQVGRKSAEWGDGLEAEPAPSEQVVRVQIEGASVAYGGDYDLSKGAVIELRAPVMDLSALHEHLDMELRDLGVDPRDADEAIGAFCDSLTQASMVRFLAKRMLRVG